MAGNRSYARISRNTSKNMSPAKVEEPVFVSVGAQESIPSLAESIPRDRCLGSLNVYKYGLRTRRDTIIRAPECIINGADVRQRLQKNGSQ